MSMLPLNIFYDEPEKDRWLFLDRYPRRVIRRIVRGKPRNTGHRMVAEELMRGLDKLKIPYRFNDYGYIRKHPDELLCCITSYLLLKHKWPNPVLLGASIFSHPMDCPDLFQQFPNVKKVVVPGEWMRKMFEPSYGDKVQSWPVGIDTEKWRPSEKTSTFNFLIYDKIRWDHEAMEQSLIRPLVAKLEARNVSYHFIRYGHYHHEDLMEKLKISDAVIFLCEHETQGLAYQQILSTGTPILAWDRGGYWQDPVYYPDKVKFGPVSSVPYWDERCGEKFSSVEEFDEKLDHFLEKNNKGHYQSRQYILENLTLEKCAEQYVEICKSIKKQNVNADVR